MSQSQLPLWVLYAQALGTPSLTVLIAGFGVWVAFRQMKLAREKLQHDTYDKKHAVFLAVRWVLTVVAGLKRAPDLEDMRGFINEMASAPFLFNDHLFRYLKQIEQRVLRASGLHQLMDHLSANDKESASRELDEHIKWLSEQRDVITEKFRPSLGFRKR